MYLLGRNKSFRVVCSRLVLFINFSLKQYNSLTLEQICKYLIGWINYVFCMYDSFVKLFWI